MKESRDVASEPRMTREEWARILCTVPKDVEEVRNTMTEIFISGMEAGQRLAGMEMK